MVNQLRGAIAVMNYDLVIGKDNDMPWCYTGDLLRFKFRTEGCNILMGRVTWESIGCQPLINRRNIVISRNNLKDVECYGSIESAIDACGDEDFWVIGGAEIYSQSIPYLNYLDITIVPDEIYGSNIVKFPNMDLSGWSAINSITIKDENDLLVIEFIRDKCVKDMLSHERVQQGLKCQS